VAWMLSGGLTSRLRAFGRVSRLSSPRGKVHRAGRTERRTSGHLLCLAVFRGGVRLPVVLRGAVPVVVPPPRRHRGHVRNCGHAPCDESEPRAPPPGRHTPDLSGRPLLHSPSSEERETLDGR
jgi:hypothetical protein